MLNSSLPRSSKPLKRCPLHRYTPMPRTSAKKRRSDSVYAKARKIVLDRCDRICEVRIPDRCTVVANTCHHQHKRSQGGNDHNPDLMIGLCWPCHDYVERHPREAAEKGWTIRRGGVA